MAAPGGSSRRRNTRDEKYSREEKIFLPKYVKERKEFWKITVEKWKFPSKNSPYQLQNFSCVDGICEDVIWKQLHELETMVFKRNESRLLQDGLFDMWCHKLWHVCQKCLTFMVKAELKKFMRTCLSKENLPKIQEKLKEHKSDLGDKLILRVKTKEQGIKYDLLNDEVNNEWNRLLKVLPMEELVIYSLDVLKKYRKEQVQSQKKQQVENTPCSIKHEDCGELKPVTKQKTSASKIPQPKYGSVKKIEVGNLDVKTNKKSPKPRSYNQENSCDKGTQTARCSKIRKHL